MSNTSRARARLVLGAAAMVSVTAACSDQPTSPRVMPSSVVAAKNGPNALPTSGRIVLASDITGNHELYSMNIDATDMRRLTYTATSEVHPSVSKDGKKLVYVRKGGPGMDEIWTSEIDGSKPRLRFRATSDMLLIDNPRFSPDAKRIAFTFRDASTSTLRIAVVDGANGSPLVLTPGDLTGELPSWSPDGLKLAYVGTWPQSPRDQVFTVSVDGTNRAQVTNYTDDDIFCCSNSEWSPDGTRILVSYYLSGAAHYAFSIDPVTGIGSPIGSSNTIVGQAVWSPDGSRILYKAPLSLRWMYANGEGATPITDVLDPVGIAWGR